MLPAKVQVEVLSPKVPVNPLSLSGRHRILRFDAGVSCQNEVDHSDLHVESLVEILLQSVVWDIRDVGDFWRNACCSHVLNHLEREIFLFFVAHFCWSKGRFVTL